MSERYIEHCRQQCNFQKTEKLERAELPGGRKIITKLQNSLLQQSNTCNYQLKFCNYRFLLPLQAEIVYVFL